jgi:hypothetical protein
MTVSVKRNKVQYTGDNSTTAFSVTFPYTETSQVKVYLGSTLQTITTHYTLTDPGATGTVTFLTPPGTGVNVSLIRETDYLQAVDYVNNDALDAETLEKAFDKLTMMAQQLDAKIDGSVGFDETVAGTTSLKLASDATDLAGKLLAFDDSGNFVTTQEIGTFRGTDTTSTTAAYVVRDLIRDSSNDNVYFTKQDAPSGTLLTNTSYFELLVDVATVRTLKVAAETARTGAETAETNAAASLASFQGQYKTGSSDPYSGSADAGDLWYDTSASILKYYTGSAFEPVTTSLATVTDNYLTISNQVITAGTVPISLGGTGATTASGARTALGLGTAATSATGDFEASGTVSTHAAVTSSVHGISAFGATLVDDADAATARTTLGLGTAATSATGDFEASGAVSTHAAVTSSVHGISSFGATLVDDADAATARTTLGLGTAATTAASAYATAAQGTLADTATQPGDNATTLNVSATDKLLGRSTAGAGAVEEITLTSAGRALLDDADAAAQRTTLGLGSAATSNTSAFEAAGSVSTHAALTEVHGISAFGATLVDDADATAARTTLGLGTAATTASTDYATSTQGSTADTALQNVVDDTTPQLGGNLDVNGNSIVSASNGNIAITPNGTGNVSLGNFTFDADQTVGVGQDNYVLTYDHSTTSISLEAATGGGGASDVVSDTSPQLGGNLDVNGQSIVSVSAGNISITPDTTGKIVLDGLSWPTTDGSADQVLKTDGAGNLSFVDQSGGGGSGSSYIQHSSTVSDSLAISAGTNRMYVGNTSFSSGGVTMAGYLVISHGYANFTGASALDVTGTLRIVG